MSGIKYYVVWKGIKTGVFLTWEECEQQIKGYTGSVYKSFKTKEAAEKAFNSDYRDYFEENKIQATLATKDIGRHNKPVTDSICVDAACSGNPGMMEYRGVDTKTGREIFHKGPYRHATNNIGEFLAIVHGLAYLKKKNSTIFVYSDSHTAITWVKNIKVKTKLEKTAANKELFDIVQRAVNWLNNNHYKNTIIKWNTEAWGEIPADFGRK